MQSCKREYFELDRIQEDVTWNPEAAVPLINSTLEVGDLLDRFDDDEIIVVDQQPGLLALRYFSEVFSVSADQVLNIQDQAGQLPFPITLGDINTLAGGSPSSNSINFSYPLDLSNFTNVPELYTINLDGGTFTINGTNTTNNDANVTITIPSLTLNGTPYSTTFFVPSGLNGGATLNMASYVMDLTTGGQGFNELSIDVQITWQTGGVSTPGQTLDFQADITNIDFGLALCDLKQQDISTGVDSVRFRIFESSEDGDLTWTNPSFNAVFTNSYGADVAIDMQTFEVRNNQQTLAVTSPFDNTVTINSDPVPVTPITTSILMDNSNSNVVTVVDIEPDKLIYDVTATTNPMGGNNNNWIADSSRIVLEMEAVLPFEGTASDYTIGDTTEVDIFPLNDDVEEIVSITLRLAINNGFPVDGFGQVVFLDSNNVPIDSLFSNARTRLIASGEIVNQQVDQANGRTLTVTDITLDRETLENLEAMGFRKMASRGWAETTDMGQTTVAIFENYTMDLFLGMNVEAVVKPFD